MNDPNKIRELKIEEHFPIGGAGIITIPREGRKPKKATCMFTVEPEAEHVSIALINGRMPTWEDMCWVKDQFWKPEEAVVQIHPRKSEYVNMVDNCLHLWRITSLKSAAELFGIETEDNHD